MKLETVSSMNNQFAYLCLPKQIVKVSDIPILLDKYNKIEIKKSNNTLNDKNSLKIIPYISINSNDLTTILGCCAKYIYLKIPILSGIQSTGNVINYKIINKLLEIEKKYNINLSISKDIINKINKQ